MATNKRLRLYKLAERVVLSRSSITRLVDALEKQSLLQRQTDPEEVLIAPSFSRIYAAEQFGDAGLG